MKFGTRRKALAILAILAIGATFARSAYLVARARSELQAARSDVARRDYRSARDRLSSIARNPGGESSDEIRYLLGSCEHALGHDDVALEHLRAVSIAGPFAANAAAAEADLLLSRGRLKEAEKRLESLLESVQAGRSEIRQWLDRVYRYQGRFDDVARLLRDGASEAENPIPLLSKLFVLDRGTPPYAKVVEAIELAAKMSPREERLDLARARVAIFENRLDVAKRMIDRCLERDPNDSAALRARLLWAKASNRPAEALESLKRLEPPGGPPRFSATERLSWRAWIFRQAGDSARERESLDEWLRADPNNPEALELAAAERLAAGDDEAASGFRRRKADVDRAIDRYRRNLAQGGPFRTAEELLEMGRLAEAGGREFDANLWHRQALKNSPNVAVPAVTRLTVVDRTGRFHADLPARSAGASAEVRPPRFVDEAESSGLRFTFRNGETAIKQSPAIMASGVGVLDYDGDGLLDVYFTQGGEFPPDPSRPNEGDRLFRNLGGGRFEDVSKQARIAELPKGYGHGVTVGDYDGDGKPDLFLTRWRSYALFRNKGDGAFEDATARAGLAGDRDWPTSAAFADLDNDGDLDLYVCHYLSWDPSNPRICRDGSTQVYMYCNPRDSQSLSDHVFRNDRGTFTDVTKESGISDREGRGLGVIASDFDDDGLVDVFVANDETANYLFRNLGGLRFEEVGLQAGVAGNASGGFQAGMGVALGDLDADGKPDLAVTNFLGESTSLFQNLGRGLFAERGGATGVAAASRLRLGFGASFLDADNDGRLDLLTANGHLNDLGDEPYLMPMQLLMGTGGGRVVDVSDRAGEAVAKPRLARGLAVADLDNDGKIDAIVTDLSGPAAFLRNRSANTNHFVTFQLEGAGSNRDGVGSKLKITAGGLVRFAERFGGGSYQSSGDPRVHFGLGGATKVDSVEVRRPSGRVDVYKNLEVDTGYLLREGSDVARRLPGFGRAEEPRQ